MQKYIGHLLFAALGVVLLSFSALPRAQAHSSTNMRVFAYEYTTGNNQFLTFFDQSGAAIGITVDIYHPGGTLFASRVITLAANETRGVRDPSLPYTAGVPNPATDGFGLPVLPGHGTPASDVAYGMIATSTGAFAIIAENDQQQLGGSSRGGIWTRDKFTDTWWGMYNYPALGDNTKKDYFFLTNPNDTTSSAVIQTFSSAGTLLTTTTFNVAAHATIKVYPQDDLGAITAQQVIGMHMTSTNGMGVSIQTQNASNFDYPSGAYTTHDNSTGLFTPWTNSCVPSAYVWAEQESGAQLTAAMVTNPNNVAITVNERWYPQDGTGHGGNPYYDRSTVVPAFGSAELLLSQQTVPTLKDESSAEPDIMFRSITSTLPFHTHTAYEKNLEMPPTPALQFRWGSTDPSRTGTVFLSNPNAFTIFIRSSSVNHPGPTTQIGNVVTLDAFSSKVQNYTGSPPNGLGYVSAVDQTFTFTATTTAGGTTQANFVAHLEEPDTGDVLPQECEGNAALNSALGNFVWHDLDADGVQDLGEPGISGVVVELLNDAGTFVLATTTTDGSGLYTFTGLDAGTYKIRVAASNFTSTGALAGKAPAPKDQGGNDATDSDGNAGNNTTDTITLPANTTDNTWDFGFTSTGAIGNFVWLDEDGNGIQDAGEPGIANVTVQLWNSDHTVMLRTTTTDAHGGYLFDNLAAGTYQVDVDNTTLPVGLVQTTIPAGSAGRDFVNHADPYTPVTLAVEGAENLTADFGYNWAPSGDVTGNTGTGAIGDRVWIDTNGNGNQDPEEAGLSGVTVQLITPGPDGLFGTGDDVIAATTTTNATGNYIFDGLAAGAYRVRIPTPPAGYTQTGDPDHYGSATGTNDNQTTAPIILGPGDVFVLADFGYQPNAGTFGSIGDFVWLDANANGVQDPGEPGIPGVTVALIRDLNGNGVRDAGEPIIATDTTDANGLYTFTGLPVADGVGTDDYLVLVNDTNNVLGSLTPTFDFDGTATQNISAATNLTSAGTTAHDFGYAPPGHATGEGLIGDTIFLDANGNGTQDAGESGMEGVTVTLTGNGQTFTAVTDENGRYYFGNLSAATYTVTVTPPAGYTNTADPDGGNNNMSSVVLGAGATNLLQDFGYQGTTTQGTIGNLVWKDLNANGVVDAGEPGIQNVTVELYRDTNGNGVIDPADSLVGKQTTNASGNYSFTGLATNDGGGDAQYLVNVTDENGVMPGWWHSLGTPNTNNHSQADPFAVTLTPGAPTNNNADFGYYVDFASLGNFVWTDTNNNGIQDSGETGVNNITIRLRITWPNAAITDVFVRTGDNPNQTGTQAGWYGFLNLLQDENYNGVGGGPTFVISVFSSGGTPTLSDQGGNDKLDSDPHTGVTATATKGVLGIDQATDANTENNAASYDFGYSAAPTGATLIAFEARNNEKQIKLKWETGTELNVVGFNVWRKVGKKGEWKVRNAELIAAANPGEAVGNAYSFGDKKVKAGKVYRYKLEIVLSDGTSEWSEEIKVNRP